MKGTQNANGTVETGTFTTEGTSAHRLLGIEGEFIRIRYANGTYEVEEVETEHEDPEAPWQ